MNRAVDAKVRKCATPHSLRDRFDAQLRTNPTMQGHDWFAVINGADRFSHRNRCFGSASPTRLLSTLRLTSNGARFHEVVNPVAAGANRKCPCFETLQRETPLRLDQQFGKYNFPPPALPLEVAQSTKLGR